MFQVAFGQSAEISSEGIQSAAIRAVTISVAGTQSLRAVLCLRAVLTPACSPDARVGGRNVAGGRSSESPFELQTCALEVMSFPVRHYTDARLAAGAARCRRGRYVISVASTDY